MPAVIALHYLILFYNNFHTVFMAKKPDKIGLFRGKHLFCLHSMVRIFLTNLNFTLRIRLMAHIFPRTFTYIASL